MDEQVSGTTEGVENQTPVDPWVAAFAALEPKGEEPAEETAGGAAGEPGADSAGANGQQAVPASDEDGDGNADETPVGGLGDTSGEIDHQGGTAFADAIGVTDADIQKYEQELNENIRNQAIDDVAREFIKRGIRNKDGVLGATMEDPDICKRDSDGVPHFYNPETGREFTGDNPRRQAQEWVDDYNKELARVFNNTCEQYENHLRQESSPQLAVMKFAPKYEKLDDIRRGMFDNIIEDYEVKDKEGKVIGYTVDLDKTLALVERQISMIQSYAKSHQPQQKQQPSGPALDMKTSSGAVPSGEQAPPTSLAEAMERLQDAQLSKTKR